MKRLAGNISLENPYIEDVVVAFSSLVGSYGDDVISIINNESNTLSNNQFELLNHIYQQDGSGDYVLKYLKEIYPIFSAMPYGQIISVNLYFVDDNGRKHNTKIV